MSTTGHASRPTRFRAGAARVRCVSTAPPPASSTRGDTIIVISYASYDRSDLEHYEPRVVHVEARTNRIVTIDDEVATLLS